MRRLLFGLLLFCVAALAESTFSIVEAKMPAKVVPGQKVVALYKVKAVSLDAPMEYRPDASVYWKDSHVSQLIQPDAISPWKVQNIKNGDVFDVKVTFTADAKVPVGDSGYVYFGMWRKIDGKYVFVKIDGKEKRYDIIKSVDSIEEESAVSKQTAPAVKGGAFEILEVKKPETVSPGQNFAVSYKIKAVSLDEPFEFRPGCDVYWKDMRKAFPVQPDKIAPWKVKNIKAGDVFDVTLNIHVDESIPLSDVGYIYFTMWRKIEGKYVFSKINGNERHYTTIKCVAPAAMNLGKETGTLPQVTVPFLKAPSIDGVFDELEWSGAVETPAFVSSMTGENYDPRTIARLGHDGEKLYILFITNEKAGYEPTKLSFTLHDGALWKNDAAEVIIKPDEADNDHFQFIADLLGQRFDAYNEDFAGYNPVWQSTSSEKDGRIVFEVAIPFSAMSKKKVASGTVWRADIFRYREKGASTSGWSPTMGPHDNLKRYGFLLFDSAKAAIELKCAFAEDARKQIPAGENDALDKLLARVQHIKGEIEHGGEAEAAAKYQPLAIELNEIQAKIGKMLFAVKHKKSGAPVVIQIADPYSVKLPNEAVTEPLTELKASFLADETRHFAFNISNLSNESRTFRFSLRYGQTPCLDGRGFDFLRLGMPNYKVQWMRPIAVATKDGSLSSDVMAECDGVYVVAPSETVQAFLSVEAQNPKPLAKGHLVIQAIDDKPFEAMALPVEFSASKTSLANAPDSFLSFGFDFLLDDIIRERPDFAKSHFKMLREYGFNNVMITALRHCPRPKADKQGNLIGDMDFTVLDNLLAVQGNQFDGYYFDVGIMDKGKQRKDLFGLDVDDPAFEKAFKTWMAAIIARFNATGITSDRLLVCPYDENMDSIAIKFSKWIKEISPKTRIVIDAASEKLDMVKAIDPYVDVWMPHLRTINQEGYKPFFAYVASQNKPVMTYYYTSGQNEKLKSPHADYAINFWLCFDRGLRGMAYWAAGQYYGDPWGRKLYPGSYDTALMYPTENGVAPSRRLMGWKRGVQDYQLLKLTEAKLTGDELRRFRENIRLVIAYPNEPQRAEILRDFCRDLLQ